MRCDGPALVLCIVLCGCATTDTEFGWTPRSAGCVQRGLFEALESPAEPADGYLGNTDIRIGVLPDTGRGLATLVHFDRRFGGLGEYLDEPKVLLSVGDFNSRTCTVVMTESECPTAAKIYRDLSAEAIQIGFQFDDPSGLSIMHGTSYYLQATDGNGNDLTWSYYGSPEHPMQTAIDRSMAELSQCLAVAEAAFRGKPSN